MLMSNIDAVLKEINKKFKTELVFQGRAEYDVKETEKIQFTSCRLN